MSSDEVDRTVAREPNSYSRPVGKSPLSTGRPVDNCVNPDSWDGSDSSGVRNAGQNLKLSPTDGQLSTTNGGQLRDYDVDHVDGDEDAESPAGPASTPDMGASALAAARETAGGRARLLGRRKRSRPGTGPVYSAARADDRDPAAIGAIFSRAIPQLGWTTPLAEARLLGQWESLVGRDIAAHCQPVSLTDGDLKIVAESTAWATQLRLLAPRMLAKICEQVPPGMVKRLSISGPSGPSWKKGPWSMPGSRGPRDTYG